MLIKNSKLILVILLFSIFSCGYVDIAGFFSSSVNVNQRFNEKNDLKDFKAPAVPDVNNFSFLVVGDTHYYDKQPDYFRKIQENKDIWGISFVIHIGDIVQNGLASAFDLALDDFASCSLPIYPVIGNHDLYNGGFSIYKNKIGRTIYDFKLGNAYFIFLDTANGTLGSLQKKWLEDRLKYSDEKYIFVISHYTPTDMEYLSYTDWSYPEERYYLLNLFDDYDVNYYLCGHLHRNDQKVIRGVNYVVIKNLNSGDDDVYYKITVNSGGITGSLL